MARKVASPESIRATHAHETTLDRSPGLTPAIPQDRLFHLDVVRGFALLGVLLCNIHFWFRAPRGRQNLSVPTWPGLADQATAWLVRALLDTKFIFLFSILFGVAMAIQAGRAEAQGARFRGLAVRRMLVLAGIGLLHVLLLWNGEILLPYAVLGLVALPFLQRSPRTLWRWVFGLWLLVLVLVLVGPVKTLLGPRPAWLGLEGIQANDLDEMETIERLASHYQAASWLAVARFRIEDYWRVLKEAIPAFFLLFTNMLTGMALWRSGLLRDPEADRPALRRLVLWALPLGLALHAIYASKFLLRALGRELPWSVSRFFPLMTDLSMMAGALILSLAMGAGLLLLLGNIRWRARLAPLAPLGRTALSAYLMQSLVMTGVFYGWGLGYYDRMGPLAGVLLGLALFAVQVALAIWWTRRFRFGPVEWAWRCAAYGRVQPFRESVPGPERS